MEILDQEYWNDEILTRHFSSLSPDYVFLAATRSDFVFRVLKLTGAHKGRSKHVLSKNVLICNMMVTELKQAESVATPSSFNTL